MTNNQLRGALSEVRQLRERGAPAESHANAAE